MQGKTILIAGVGFNDIDVVLAQAEKLKDQFDKVLICNPEEIIGFFEEPFEKQLQRLEIEQIKLEVCQDFLFEERFESRSGWYIPRTIGTPSRGYRFQYKSTIRKQYNKPRFIWRIKKQKKNL